jgi:hypothetical protein
MDPVWVGQTAVGQSNMSNARANTRRAAGVDRDAPTTSESKSVDVSGCRNSMSQTRLESTYRGRVMLQGREKADAWLRQECGNAAGAIASSATGKSPGRRDTATAATRDADEKGCRIVTRPVAGLGGAPMTMGMVRECD